jgi:hypothetical protein
VLKHVSIWVAPTALDVPIGQLVHIATPSVALHVPAGQLIQKCWYEPALQVGQSRTKIAPVPAALYVPAGQSVQDP